MSETLVSVDALAASHGALLGLDHGTKTIGVAASDPARMIATPVTTIKRKKFSADADALAAIIADYDAVGLVLGLPLNMDGSAGPRVQSTRAFARNLAARVTLPIAVWDERWSTIAADRAMLEADLSRRARRESIDKVAATIILQGALDRLRALRNAPPIPEGDAPS